VAIYCSEQSFVEDNVLGLVLRLFWCRLAFMLWA